MCLGRDGGYAFAATRLSFVRRKVWQSHSVLSSQAVSWRFNSAVLCGFQFHSHHNSIFKFQSISLFLSNLLWTPFSFSRQSGLACFVSNDSVPAPTEGVGTPHCDFLLLGASALSSFSSELPSNSLLDRDILEAEQDTCLTYCWFYFTFCQFLVHPN